MVQVERYFGAAFYFNPQRWATVDGYAPWHVVWVAWRAMLALQAQERLSFTRAVRLAMAQGAHATTGHDEDVAAAFPPDSEDEA